MRTNRKRVAVAFTLVELLVALLIVIALAVVTVPAIAPMLQVNRVQSAAHALKAALVHARSVALARHQNAICWIANGTVVESGTLTRVSATGETIVDNQDAEFSTVGTWAESNVADEWAGSSVYRWTTDGGTATWTPALTVAGTYEVYAWWANHNETSNRDSDAEYTVTYAGGAQDTIAVDQDDDGGQWNLLGTYAFDASGTENVTLLSDLSDPEGRPTSADAAKFVCLAGSSPNMFKSQGAAWATDTWAKDGSTGEYRYFVTVANQTDASAGYEAVGVIAPIESSTSDVVTIGGTWANPDGLPPNTVSELTAGSRFVIHEDDTATRRSVGSGVDDAMRWDPLPEGAMVDPIDPDDPAGERRSLPIIFAPTGRARLYNRSYITIRVYDIEQPNSPDSEVYLRVFANTGRVAIAKDPENLPH